MSVPDEPGARPRELRDGRHSHGGHSSERATLEEICAEPADLLVIGGGITGAGVARDAAMRGLRTVLVEQDDLGVGHQLALEPADPRRPALPRDGRPSASCWRPIASAGSCSGSRRTWSGRCRSSFPLHRGDRISRWRLAAGMWLYDAAGSVPQCATAPDARQARDARSRADAARAGPARRRPLLRRPVRRRPARAWPRRAPRSITARWSRTTRPCASLERTAAGWWARSWRMCSPARAGRRAGRRRGERHRPLDRPGAAGSRIRPRSRCCSRPRASTSSSTGRGSTIARRSSSRARSTAASCSSCPGATSRTSAPPTPIPPRRPTSVDRRPRTTRLPPPVGQRALSQRPAGRRRRPRARGPASARCSPTGRRRRRAGRESTPSCRAPAA